VSRLSRTRAGSEHPYSSAGGKTLGFSSPFLAGLLVFFLSALPTLCRVILRARLEINTSATPAPEAQEAERERERGGGGSRGSWGGNVGNRGAGYRTSRERGGEGEGGRAGGGGGGEGDVDERSEENRSKVADIAGWIDGSEA